MGFFFPFYLHSALREISNHTSNSTGIETISTEIDRKNFCIDTKDETSKYLQVSSKNVSNMHKNTLQSLKKNKKLLKKFTTVLDHNEKITLQAFNQISEKITDIENYKTVYLNLLKSMNEYKIIRENMKKKIKLQEMSLFEQNMKNIREVVDLYSKTKQDLYIQHNEMAQKRDEFKQEIQKKIEKINTKALQLEKERQKTKAKKDILSYRVAMQKKYMTTIDRQEEQKFKEESVTHIKKIAELERKHLEEKQAIEELFLLERDQINEGKQALIFWEWQSKIKEEKEFSWMKLRFLLFEYFPDPSFMGSRSQYFLFLSQRPWCFTIKTWC